MIAIIAALVVAAAIAWTGRLIAAAVRATQVENARARAVTLLQLFAPAMEARYRDPRALLVWQPLAQTARRIFPSEFTTLDQAAGGTFPFTKADLEAAHAEWTSDWLAWELAHDAEYKMKAAAVERELAREPESDPALARARVEAVEREKLESYQRRYQEYVRVAKALQALTS